MELFSRVEKKIYILTTILITILSNVIVLSFNDYSEFLIV